MSTPSGCYDASTTACDRSMSRTQLNGKHDIGGTAMVRPKRGTKRGTIKCSTSLKCMKHRTIQCRSISGVSTSVTAVTSVLCLSPGMPWSCAVSPRCPARRRWSCAARSPWRPWTWRATRRSPGRRRRWTRAATVGTWGCPPLETFQSSGEFHQNLGSLANLFAISRASKSATPEQIPRISKTLIPFIDRMKTTSIVVQSLSR